MIEGTTLGQNNLRAIRIGRRAAQSTLHVRLDANTVLTQSCHSLHDGSLKSYFKVSTKMGSHSEAEFFVFMLPNSFDTPFKGLIVVVKTRHHPNFL